MKETINFLGNDKNKNILVCKGNKILISNDEGESWEFFWSFKNSYPLKLFFDNQNNYFLILRKFVLNKEEERVYKILDNNLIEIKLDYGENIPRIHDIYFDDKNNIYISMYLLTISLCANYIYKSEDQINWKYLWFYTGYSYIFNFRLIGNKLFAFVRNNAKLDKSNC